MSELPEGVRPAEVPTPRESASAIVLRGGDPGWEVLLGVRSRRARFMPGHHAFPGGGMEPADRPAEPGCHERCAARELAEETGLAIAAGAWSAAGERVTPPLFPLRFRTLFFVARWPAGSAPPQPTSAENERLLVLDPARVLAEWERGEVNVPPPVLPILRAIAAARGRPFAEVVRAIAETNEQEGRAPRIEFVPGVWMLPQRTATLPPATHTNCWMPGTRRFAVVDPGSSDPEEIDRLFAVIERRAAEGETPVAVLLTHRHRDHSSGALVLARALSVPLAAHPATLESAGSAASGVRLEPLADGDELDLGGERLVVHHTPGHAAGHLSFELPGRGAVIAGDMISGLSTILIDPIEGDMGAYLVSLARLARLGCRVLLPGHGPPLPAAELGRVGEHRRMRAERILAALDTSTAKRLPEIAREAYADAGLLPRALTDSQTLSHLMLLEREGRARREDAAGERWRRARSSG